MAVVHLAVETIPNQLGGPLSNRAKWVITADAGGGVDTITNAELVAAFTTGGAQQLSPQECRDALNATYANLAAAQSAIDNAGTFSISSRQRSGLGIPGVAVGIDATPGKATLVTTFPAVVGEVIVEVEFHHSETR